MPLIKCDACGAEQSDTNQLCVRCNQKIYKHGYPLMKDEVKQNPIVKEISCLRCRTLWVGVTIAGFVLVTILNIFFNLFSIGWSLIIDLIRYPVAFVSITGGSYFTYKLLSYYCHGDGKGGTVYLSDDISVNKGSKTALILGLALAIGVILLTIVTLMYLNSSILYYQIDKTTGSYDPKLLDANCPAFKLLVFKSWSNANVFQIDYYDTSIGYPDITLEPKWLECKGERN